MFSYATAPKQFKNLVSNIFSAYPVILKKLWGLIILISFLQIIISLIGQYFGLSQLDETGMLSSHFLVPQIAFIAISVLLSIFFGVVALYSSDQVLRKVTIHWQSTIAYALQRYWRVLGYVFLLIAGYLLSVLLLGVMTGLLLYGLAKGLHLDPKPIIPFFWLLYGVFYISLVIILYWGIPAIVLDKVKLIAAFKVTFGLVKGNWRRVFFVCLLTAVIVTLLFVLSGVVSYFSVPWGMAGQVLDYIVVFLVSVVTFPLMMATILVIYKDLKLRRPHLVK